ncbi:hypothetical protein AALP_AA5G015700 [Arabis alpina]|uniref:LOV domain-containing protein n=1 Tax=Arabis alpina TaxID=50452 RepID=A0A087GU99_ARAAL|nr:hypothetical protein AALP_AA5G015700 [Arabis alpina]
MEEESFNTRYSLWIKEALDELPHNFTITDPFLSNHPIVFASLGFLKMTGYTLEEVIGRNGRAFQGPKTNRRSVLEIREAIRQERSIQLSLLNYSKSGSAFWILFHMVPVFGKDDGKVINFVAVQVPINGQEMIHRNVVDIGSCRREVFMHQERDLSVECDVQGLEDWEHCEASESEKLKAVEGINNVLSILTRYSELSGRLVCGKRCCLRGADCLSSSLVISLGRIKQSFVLTNPCLPDMPIVYASDAFLTLTGYKRQEVLGQNCRFLSGVDTDSSVLYEMKECILKGQSCTVQILNYSNRKDKSSFWNLLHISPVRNASGKTAYFVGVQVEASCRNTESQELRPETRQLSVVGAVRVAGSSSRPSSSSVESDEQGLEDWEHCEASESEKLKAVEGINNVLSILTRYSELSGRLVCGKRCCLRGADCLSSSLVISLGRIKQSFVLTNPCLPDMPIVYASDAFLTLTGYKRQEVLGQNCRFLSGVDTDSSVLYEMKECILKGQSCTVQILNYSNRKDKSSFWNLLHISPVRNASGKTAYFVGVQVEASCRNTESQELRPETRQLSVVGAVRVAVRSSFMVTY